MGILDFLPQALTGGLDMTQATPPPAAPAPTAAVDDTMMRAEIARRLREKMEAEQAAAAEAQGKPAGEFTLNGETTKQFLARMEGQGASKPAAQQPPAQQPVGILPLGPAPAPAARGPEAVAPSPRPIAAPQRAAAPARNLGPSAPPQGADAPFDVPFTTKLRDALLAVGGVAPPDRANQARNQNMTYQALLAKGVDATTAQGMVANPALMAQMAPQIFGAKEIKTSTFKLPNGDEVTGVLDQKLNAYVAPDGTILHGPYAMRNIREFYGKGGPKDAGQPSPAAALTPPPALGTDASSPAGAPQPGSVAAMITGANRDQNPIYSVAPAPPGTNAKQWTLSETKRIEGDIADDADKARGALEYVKQAGHVRGLLNKPIEGDKTGRKHGDVIGPWASVGSGDMKSNFERAANAQSVGGAVAALADPQGIIDGIRKVGGTFNSDMARDNSARQQINKALTSLQQSELRMIYPGRMLAAGIQQNKEANPTINAQDQKTVEDMLSEREKVAFDKIMTGLKGKSINPAQIDPEVARRGVELGVFKEADFPQAKSDRLLSTVAPEVKAQLLPALAQAGIDINTKKGADYLEQVLAHLGNGGGK